MPVASNIQKVMEVSRSGDPRQGIKNIMGDLSDFEVEANLVLVAIYIRPEKTKGGIIRPDANVEEDIYQGKVGLVLKKGPIAYAEWEDEDKRGQVAKEDDWVVSNIGDGWAIRVKGYPCRLIPYERIRMRVSDPEAIF